MAISVVIPSLGGDLSKTLSSLNSGTITPSEIIICLPNNGYFVNDLSKYNNILVVYSGRKGQVSQRITGFLKAKNEYIMQLDDDVHVDKYCLEVLEKHMLEVDNASISPVLYDSKSKKPITCKKKISKFMSLYYYLINGDSGYKPGVITLAGTNFGFHPGCVNSDNKLFEVEWQPGGCILHRKEGLILNDYFPYKGKAYSEDLIHSYLLRLSKKLLYVAIDAKCMTNIPPKISLFRELYNDYKARLYFVKIANLSIARMHVHYLFYIVKIIAGYK